MANGAGEGWWMYQGGPAHGGFVGPASAIDPANGGALSLKHQVALGGPVLSVPAVTEGYVYVGVANSQAAYGGNGGSFHKVSLETGEIEHTFTWDIPVDERDTHGFTGMGCTPAVADGRVYFSAFNGKFYCLSADDLSLQWVTDLRYADPVHNQPVTNDMGSQVDAPAAGWSSPVVAGGNVYVGMGEGENPDLFGFVYCLDTATGNVKWLFCTCRLDPSKDNEPNQIPSAVVRNPPPPMFTVVPTTDDTPRGASVWSCIAYDADLDRLYLTTGNPARNDSGLPSAPAGWTDPHAVPGCTVSLPFPDPVVAQPYTYSVLALDASTGALLHRFEPTQDTSYRPSDLDIDFGGSPALYTQNGEKRVAVANKNGSLFILDQDLNRVNWRQLLPYDTSGQRVPTVDPHPVSQDLSPPTPPNCESDNTTGENFSGPFGTPAVDTANGIIFVGLGGPNYHYPAPGIDSQSTPFLRAVRWDTLEDAWEMAPFTFPTTQGNVTVDRYVKAAAAMYQNPGEGSIGSPAVANDVVFVGTQGVAVHAFECTTGALVWQDVLGQETLGLNGGYGYCMGPALYGPYVVAGGLINGRDGGILRIYRLP